AQRLDDRDQDDEHDAGRVANDLEVGQRVEDERQRGEDAQRDEYYHVGLEVRTCGVLIRKRMGMIGMAFRHDKNSVLTNTNRGNEFSNGLHGAGSASLTPYRDIPPLHR